MTIKICSICEQDKPIEEFAFRKDRGSHIGDCKSCKAAKVRAHRNKNIERYRARINDWLKRNPEKRKAYEERDRLNGGKERAKAWRTKYADKQREACRRYRERNRKPKQLSLIDQNKNQAISEYQRGDSILDVSLRYECNVSTLRKRLKQWGIAVRKRIYESKRPILTAEETAKHLQEWNRKKGAWRKGKSTYQLWVAKYGIKEADRRNAKMKRKMSRSSRGANNAMFGKPSPSESSRGGTGWFRGCFFRSLRELSYMMKMDDEGSKWISAETISIPYVALKTRRTYHPDFLVNDTNLIEIKPTRKVQHAQTKAKARAARRYCLNRGWTYQMIDPVLDIDRIYREYIRGSVTFTAKFEDKFMDRYAMDGKLITY